MRGRALYGGSCRFIIVLVVVVVTFDPNIAVRLLAFPEIRARARARIFVAALRALSSTERIAAFFVRSAQTFALDAAAALFAIFQLFYRIPPLVCESRNMRELGAVPLVSALIRYSRARQGARGHGDAKKSRNPMTLILF